MEERVLVGGRPLLKHPSRSDPGQGTEPGARTSRDWSYSESFSRGSRCSPGCATKEKAEDRAGAVGDWRTADRVRPGIGQPLVFCLQNRFRLLSPKSTG